MFKISSGFWVYLLTILILILSGLYLFYRQKHQLISTEQLLSTSSSHAIAQSNPCLLHIIGGIPFSPSPDGNFQLNILCPDGQSSPNYLKFSTLNTPTAAAALRLLSQINNFSYQLDSQGQIVSLGNIKNNSQQSWHFYLNNSKQHQSLDKIFFKIDDLLEIKYE